MLNRSQITRYQDQGFLVLNGLFKAAQIRRLRQAAAGIVAEFDIDRHRTVFSTRDNEAGRDAYFFDSAEAVHCFLEEDAVAADGSLQFPRDRAINKIGHALHDHVPEFTAFCRQPVLGELLRDVGQHAPLLWQTMYIFKQPAIGGEVRWHQDASYLATSPSSVVGIWVALEDATRDNGCLWMQPGGHRSALREIYQVNWNDGTARMQVLETMAWAAEGAVPVEAAAGSLVLFHDHMPHYSSANRSDRSRQAFTLHAADAGSTWSAGNWLQRRTLPEFKL